MPSKKPKAEVVKPPKPKPPKPAVAPEQVTRLAYELYLQRGGGHGRDQEDWFMAERILVEERRKKNGRRQAAKGRRLEDKFRSR
jgi:hypothetical protein